MSPTGLGCWPRGSSSNSQGTPSMILMFLGRAAYPELLLAGGGGGGFTPVRQLVDDTLVAVVDMLRVLELLYRVKAEVEVPALDVVLIELRQLPEITELALDATGRPLRVLLGEIARSLRRSVYAHRSEPGSGLREETSASDRLLALEGGGVLYRSRRPLLQVEGLSSWVAGAE